MIKFVIISKKTMLLLNNTQHSMRLTCNYKIIWRITRLILKTTKVQFSNFKRQLQHLELESQLQLLPLLKDKNQQVDLKYLKKTLIDGTWLLGKLTNLRKSVKIFWRVLKPSIELERTYMKLRLRFNNSCNNQNSSHLQMSRKIIIQLSKAIRRV